MKHLLFIIFLLVCTGCKNLHDDKPANLIAQEQMIQILADIHMADAVVDHKSGTQAVDLPLTNVLYMQIYHNRHITAEQFKASYKYYEARPQLMDNMYVQVINELSKREALLKK